MEEYSIVGIDFGTSTTVVKVKNYGEGINPKDYHSLQFNSSNCLPTLIFEDKNKVLYFGYEAERKAKEETEGIWYKNFKMGLLGNSDQQDNAKWLIEEFFKYIYSEFNQNRQRLNVRPIVKTYVSYPAKWPAEIRGMMKQCAIKAGFGTESNVFGESEPTAAIYASVAAHLDDLQKEHIIISNRPVNVMMLDMGAGTSDIAIFKFKINDQNKPVIDEIITYPTADNVYLCGGREIDKFLTDYLTEYVKKLSKNNEIPNAIVKAIKDEVKSWKEQNVSGTLRDNQTIRFPGQIAPQLKMLQQYGILNDISFDGIDRRKFELLTQSHWKQLRSLINDAIKEGEKKLRKFNGAKDIDLVILTGGHSQWYGVKEFILGKSFAGLEPIDFPKIKQQERRLLQEPHPQETVANGLVYKDIEFDVKFTMGNSLWVKYTVEGMQSDVMPVANFNDVLPIKQSLSFQNDVPGTILRTKAVPVKCEFLYGSEIETAKCISKSCDIEVPDAILRYLVITIFSPIVSVSFIAEWVKNGWDSAVESLSEFYNTNYSVIITSDININEDESVVINGNINIDNSNNIPFTIKIG
jgi:molecular chaperone DnaK (HSP70)